MYSVTRPAKLRSSVPSSLAPKPRKLFLRALRSTPAREHSTCATRRITRSWRSTRVLLPSKPPSAWASTRTPASWAPTAAIWYVSDWGSRTVSVVDTEKARRVREIAVGLRPNDLTLAPDGRLFVACAGDNTVHVIQTRSVETAEPDASPSRRLPEGTREVISTSLYPDSPEGSTPDSVAVSPDGRTLFVANADNNCVMVVDISNSLSEEARRNRESVSVVEASSPSAGIRRPSRSVRTTRRCSLLTAKAWPPAPTSHPGPPTPAACTCPFFRLYRPHPERLSLVHPAPRCAQMAAYTQQVRRNSLTRRTIPARSGAERLRHSRPGWRAVPDQVRALYHQGEPHLRPGVWRLPGCAGQTRRKWRFHLVMYGENVTRTTTSLPAIMCCSTTFTATAK